MASRLRVPSQNAEYRSVNAPWTYFFSPACPERSVVSSNPATADAVIRVPISATTSPARLAAFARHEWMNPSDTARRPRRRSAAGTAPPGRAGKPPGTPPAPGAWGRSTARSPARPPGAARRASSRRRISRLKRSGCRRTFSRHSPSLFAACARIPFGADLDNNHRGGSVAPVVPCVTGAALNNAAARRKMHFLAVIEFQPDLAIGAESVVDSVRRVHAGIIRLNNSKEARKQSFCLCRDLGWITGWLWHLTAWGPADDQKPRATRSREVWLDHRIVRGTENGVATLGAPEQKELQARQCLDRNPVGPIIRRKYRLTFRGNAGNDTTSFHGHLLCIDSDGRLDRGTFSEAH